MIFHFIVFQCLPQELSYKVEAISTPPAHLSFGIAHCSRSAAGSTSDIHGKHSLGLVHHIAIAAHIAAFEILIRMNLHRIAAPDGPLGCSIRCFHASRVGG